MSSKLVFLFGEDIYKYNNHHSKKTCTYCVSTSVEMTDFCRTDWQREIKGVCSRENSLNTYVCVHTHTVESGGFHTCEFTCSLTCICNSKSILVVPSWSVYKVSESLSNLLHTFLAEAERGSALLACFSSYTVHKSPLAVLCGVIVCAFVGHFAVYNDPQM